MGKIGEVMEMSTTFRGALAVAGAIALAGCGAAEAGDAETAASSGAERFAF